MPRKRKTTSPSAPLAVAWWGTRWLQLLSSFGFKQRLDKGRELAQAGGVGPLVLGAGAVDSEVRDATGTPYAVAIRVEPLPEKVFDLAVRVLAGRASFTASLLSGRLPEEIDIVFAAAGGDLLPDEAGALGHRCSCREEPAPCRHAAAVHWALADRLDRDPFLVFLLRGKTREELLARIRKARSLRPAGATVPRAEEAKVPMEPLPDVRPDSFFRSVEPLALLRTHLGAPEHPDAIVARLGPPPLSDPEAARLLVDFHRAIGHGATERLSEWEWKRIR